MHRREIRKTFCFLRKAIFLVFVSMWMFVPSVLFAAPVSRDDCDLADGDCRSSCKDTEKEIGVCNLGNNPQKCCVVDPAKTSSPSASASFSYTPLETIPGTEGTDTSTLEGFLQGLYRFALWSIGVAALFMITIGGFWYLTSAGNTSRVGEAKKIIGNALTGLAMVLFAWLILYVINPDLVKIDLRSLEVLRIRSEDGVQQNPDDPDAPPPPPGSEVPRPLGPVGGQCAGMDMQAALQSSQCGEASVALLSLISCMESKVPNAQISSISDNQGFQYCQYHWARPPCAHSSNSCHYGGSSKAPKSCAVDISTRGVGSASLVNAGKECNAAFVLNEGNHVHFSVNGCDCDGHN
jgi:hypothetical protein